WTSGTQDIISDLTSPGDLSSWTLDLVYILFYITYESIFGLGTISGVFLLVQIIQPIKNIGHRDVTELRIAKFEDFDFSQTIEFAQRKEIVKFSIKQFRRQVRVVASFPILFVLFTVFLALIINFNFFGTQLLRYLEGEATFSSIFNFFLLSSVWNLLLMTACFVLFFYPQNTLRNIINERKEKTLSEFESFYELKLMQWIQVLERTDVADEKTRLESEMKILKEKIEELSRISGWPFEVKQGLTVIGAALIPIISFVISIIVSIILEEII
ncbi:MAG: hypothetical protein ACFFCQ_11065, partial [Promethearchaeota archaeon]